MRTYTLPRVYVTLDGRLLSLPVDNSVAAGLARAIGETADLWHRRYLSSLTREGADTVAAIREMVTRVERDLAVALDAWRVECWTTERDHVRHV